MNILVINAGSSSHRIRLYDMDASVMSGDPLHPVWQAHIDWAQHSDKAAVSIEADGQPITEDRACSSKTGLLKDVLAQLLSTLEASGCRAGSIDAVGHRIVHCGSRYAEPVVLDSGVKREIDELAHLAPAHNPLQLDAVRTAEEMLPDALQIAVFDTAFHQSIPRQRIVYPIPYEWLEKGIRRYGFHGISHHYCAEKAAQILQVPLKNQRMVTCHLGNGSSLAAIRNGACRDTTMGFTPLEGLMMGSRCGSIDPGILIHLIQRYDMDADALDRMLNHSSGIKGISGLSSDMRAVLAAAEEGHQRSRLAIEMYVHRLRSAIGAMITSIEGIDALVFTGGIGENSAELRERVCERFHYIGLELDTDKNRDDPIDTDIAAERSAVRVIVIRANEEWEIARQCHRLITARISGSSNQRE